MLSEQNNASLDPSRKNFLDVLVNKSNLKAENIDFVHRSIISALQAFKEKKYTKFDAQTATTCCHGLALLKTDLKKKISHSDVEEILSVSIDKKSSITPKINMQWDIREEFILLSRLFLLGHIKERDSKRVFKTVVNNLKKISKIGSRFCTDVVSDLQLHIGNLVADRYSLVADQLPNDMIVSKHPVHVWKKYVSQEFIRVDRRGRKYAPCLFSMQITLAHLSHTHSHIAIVNDLHDNQGNITGRYTQILKGNGNGTFKKTTMPDDKEPIVIFGSVVYDDNATIENNQKQLEPWLHKFTELVLACDTKYPQYPKVGDDPNFNSQPITPHEQELQQTISNAKKIQGVCSKDPSLFCLVHIYVASAKQVKANDLPPSFLSEVARTGK